MYFAQENMIRRSARLGLNFRQGRNFDAAVLDALPAESATRRSSRYHDGAFDPLQVFVCLERERILGIMKNPFGVLIFFLDTLVATQFCVASVLLPTPKK